MRLNCVFCIWLKIDRALCKKQSLKNVIQTGILRNPITQTHISPPPDIYTSTKNILNYTPVSASVYVCTNNRIF